MAISRWFCFFRSPDHRITRSPDRPGCFPRLCHQWPVAVRTAIAEELPDVAYLCNHVQVEIGHHNFILVPAGLGDDLASWIAEVTLAIKLANIPRRLASNSIDRPDKISIRDSMRRLLQLPQIF